ncbi:MAG: zinc-dependent peptidase [Acidimicrobiia bacterium]|nr:zinc-dependent peptidase [Acidimicrobiia bacterium]MYE74287.1 zinc-dependent peptidase [Acidimicrobiia bacterium]MYJ63230.1 zinc-dependent peptidase [Acidimicrobiia bacterium]
MQKMLKFSRVVAVAAFVAAASILFVPAASAQTAEDVKQRDQLIANQENLLNTYRCLFGVDTDVVPGSCPNPDVVVPGVTPEKPSQQDLDVRDGLIQNQEALLNVYRCRFDVDTEIVPGGCVDGAPAPVLVEESETGPEPLGPPPAAFGFDPFYGKYLDAGGLPVIASAQVPDEALVQVKRLVEEMLGNREDILAKFGDNNVRVAVMAKASGITELPELSDLYEVFPGTDWDERTRGGGVGPTLARPVVAIAEEHLLCYDSDVFPFEDIFVHEFAHGVLNMGVELLPGGSEFRQRLETAYREALGAGLWADTYAATNPDEYWAEGVQSWFDLNNPPGWIHNEIDTRRELEAYDPALATLIQEVFGSATVESSCHG